MSRRIFSFFHPGFTFFSFLLPFFVNNLLWMQKEWMRLIIPKIDFDKHNVNTNFECFVLQATFRLLLSLDLLDLSAWINIALYIWLQTRCNKNNKVSLHNRSIKNTLLMSQIWVWCLTDGEKCKQVNLSSAAMGSRDQIKEVWTGLPPTS